MSKSSSKPTRVVRSLHNKENPYFMMVRETAQDRNLSWEARGMLAYLLSRPDSWVLKPSDLQQKCGRDKVYKILKELETAGYLERVQQINSAGKFVEFEYHYYEQPHTEIQETEGGEANKPPVPKEQGAKPRPDLPDTEKPHSIEYRGIENTDILSSGEKPPPDKSQMLIQETLIGLAGQSIVTEAPRIEPPKKEQSLFDWVALEIHGLTKINGHGAMVGKTLKSLKADTGTETPEQEQILLRDLVEMRKWWTQTKFDKAGNPIGQARHLEPLRNALNEYRASQRYKDLREQERYA